MYSLLAALTLALLVPSTATRSVSDTYFQSVPAERRFLPLANPVRLPTPIPIKKTDLMPAPMNARSITVIDWESGLPLYEKNSAAMQPIASITKLMTALVVVSLKPDWNSPVTFLDTDNRSGGIAYLLPDEQVTMNDLFHLSLVASANSATVALARATGLSERDFVAKMNAKAKAMGMRDTFFVDATGLDPANISTARDVALLVRQALGTSEIRAVVSKSSYELVTKAGRTRLIRNTDDLLDTSGRTFQLLGGKTGYLDEAGYCFATAGQDTSGNKVVSVVLGAESKGARFQFAQELLQWAFENYLWLPRKL